MNLLADGSLKLFFVVTIVVMITPGPAVFLAITNGVLHGIGKACFSILGNMSGFVVLSFISFLGLGLIVSKWELAFDVIKWGGGLYLIYLGYGMWNTHRERVGVEEEAKNLGAKNSTDLTPLKMYRRGFFVTLSNPKAIIFVAALFPQFIDDAHILFPQYLLLTSTMILSQGVVLFGYAFLASKARAALNKSGNMRKVYKVSGATFGLFGIALFFSQR